MTDEMKAKVEAIYKGYNHGSYDLEDLKDRLAQLRAIRDQNIGRINVLKEQYKAVREYEQLTGDNSYISHFIGCLISELPK